MVNSYLQAWKECGQLCRETFTSHIFMDHLKLWWCHFFAPIINAPA